MSSDEWARRQIEALELRMAALERRLAGELVVQFWGP